MVLRILTVIVDVVLYDRAVWGLELGETKVCNLKNPTTVHEAVGGLETAMGHYLAVVDIDHSLVNKTIAFR